MIARPPDTSKPDFTSIQALRAFAALAVVSFHVIRTGKEHGYDAPLLAFLDGWGACGVDIFFVISGFVMTLVQRRRKDTPRSFAANRIARIVPLYWSLTAVFAAVGFIVPSALHSHVVTIEWMLLSFAFLSQIVLRDQPILFIGWTLEIEMLFYALFALSLFARRRAVAVAFAASAVVAAALVLELPILVEFVFGMAIGEAYRRWHVSRSLAMACVGIGSAGLCAWLFVPAEARIDRLIVWGVPAAFLVFGAANMRQLTWRIATALGDASYSIYLMQVFTIPVFVRLISTIAETRQWPVTSAIGCLVFTAFAGLLLHSFFDLRIHAIAKEWLCTGRQTANARAGA